ncbi:uncharacterized protein BX663DRAFT_450694, partial [Cokeromyces recurvatus]|uniref:uncharacterized protein n=1 Tax=Cokeromyces recurvatus TaxID=90255 RepID=UPI002220BCEF
MHTRLCLFRSIEDSLSFLLSPLPQRKPRGPIICAILYEIYYLLHNKTPPPPS